MLLTDTVGLTIRSTIKKIDEMSFQCPLTWTVYQLKTFVAMTHKQGQDFFKPSKTHLYFGGNPLNDEDTLETVLQNRNLKHRYTFIAKFIASLEPEDANKQSAEEDLEKMKILDEHYRLFMDPIENYKKNTNIEELECFTKLPIMTESVSKQLVKREIEENLHNAQQEGNVNNEIEEQEERNLEQQYIIKLAIRILIVFLLFRSHFQGNLFYVFLAVLVIYCLIKLSQRRVKQRRQVVQQNPPRPGAPQVREQNLNQPEPGAPENMNEPNLVNKIKEFVICFVSSFYPSWDMNLYIENNPVAPVNPAVENGEDTQNINTDNTNNQNDGTQPVVNEPEKEIVPQVEAVQKPEEKAETNSLQPEKIEGTM